jgi:hypothetical protein
MKTDESRKHRERVIFLTLLLCFGMFILLIPATATLPRDNLVPLFAMVGQLLCAFGVGFICGREGK